MNSSTWAKIIPIAAAVIGVFLLAFWLAGARRPNSDVTLRQPTASDHAPNVSGQGTATVPAPSGAPTGGSAPATTSVPRLAGAWARFRGDNCDNICTDPTPLATSWPASLKQFWSVDLGEGYASAAIRNDRVYVLDYDEAAQADTLRCFAFATGQELWRRSYPVRIKSNHGKSRTVPAVTEKYVVTMGPMCQVMCADAVTGELRWQLDLTREYGTQVPPWYAGQCPLIDGNRVIIAPGGKALMIGLDLAGGKVLWQTPNPRGWQMTHSSIIPMTVQGQKMFVYCASGGVAGVSPEGSLLWETTDWTVPTANIPVPVPIGDGRVFITGGYNAGSIMLQVNKAGSGFSVQTLYRVPSNIFSSDQQSPILYKGYLYGVLQGGQLACLDLNGKQAWVSGPGHRFGMGPYLIAGGMIYLLDDMGTLTLVEATPAGYRQLAQARILGGPDAWGPLAMAAGRLIARDYRRMVCVDVARH